MCATMAEQYRHKSTLIAIMNLTRHLASDRRSVADGQTQQWPPSESKFLEHTQVVPATETAECRSAREAAEEHLPLATAFTGHRANIDTEYQRENRTSPPSKRIPGIPR